ncbi:MAG TPA: hypothetical protein V6D47_03190 [Oscillatoriaceae cyanobacterium]
MQQPPAELDNLSDAELQAKLEEAKANLAKQMQRARKQFAYNVKLSRDRLAYAESELRQSEEAWAKAKGTPEAVTAELLRHVNASYRRMMQIQLKANEHNLAVAETEPVPEQPLYVDPQADLDYLEARGYMDVSLGMFYWILLAEGIDLLLRASGQPGTIVCRSPEEEQARAEKANELKARAANERSLAVLLGQLGAELPEAFRLLNWGKETLARLQSGEEDKKAALSLADWNKLSAKVLLLGDLPQKASAVPLLAAYLPSEQAALPFEPVNWDDTANQAPGTDRLSISTDRLNRPGSNRLSR